jgi:hypothetical protein
LEFSFSTRANQIDQLHEQVRSEVRSQAPLELREQVLRPRETPAASPRDYRDRAALLLWFGLL